MCIDSSVPLLSRWPTPLIESNIAFCCMDALKLGFPASAFAVVLERASLHHIAAWESALDEMFRVARRYVLLEEPVDDPRSSAKRRTMEAQDLYLELQREVGYAHFRHLAPDRLLAAVARRGTILESQLLKRDDPVSVDDYFAAFPRFAALSGRPSHWESRFSSFLKSLGDGILCESDSIVVLAEVLLG